MASWCKQDPELAERGQLDGCQIDQPEGIFPLDDSAYERLRITIWSDMQRAGCSLRKIACIFGVTKDQVSRSIKFVPDYARDEQRVSKRYFDRLKDVVDSNPKNLSEFIESMQRKAGTLGFEHSVFHNAGIRRSSVHTILGSPRKPKTSKEATP